jgi:hypothetical protein
VRNAGQPGDFSLYPRFPPATTNLSRRVEVGSSFGVEKWYESVQNRNVEASVVLNWELQLARPLRTHHCGLPEVVRTLGDALDLIDEDLPETLRFRPAWREVKEMLDMAAETRTGQAVERATTLLEHALADEGWLN